MKDKLHSCFSLFPLSFGTHGSYWLFFFFHKGSIGVRVKIMLPHDPKGIMGPMKQQADVVTILEPKEEM